MSSPWINSPASIIVCTRDARAGEMIAQGIFFGQGIAQAKPALQLRHRSPGRRGTRGPPCLLPGRQAARKNRTPHAPAPHAGFSARFSSRLRLGRDLRQGKPGVMGETLDRVGERKPFGLHHKIENIAVFAGGKVEPGHFLVIDKEGWRFFRVEWGKPFPFAPGPHQFDAPAHDLRYRKPGFNLIEKGRRKSHGGAQRLNARIWRAS